jgi:diguanylate cyclase (GGDEF)-like protein
MSLPPVNRKIFLAQLQASMDRARELRRDTGIALIDISNLPEINLQVDVQTGDRLLELLHRSLVRIAKHQPIVHRIAGHTYALLLENLTQPALVVVAISRIRQLLLDTLEVDPSPLPPRLSIGVATTHANKVNARELLAIANVSLGESRSGIAFSPESLLNPVQPEAADDALLSAFDMALRKNEFELHYQPQISLVSGQVSGVEALLRWQHPTLGFIAPEQVLLLGATLGKSFELTRFLLQVGVRALGDWQHSYPDLRLALNLSADLIGHSELIDLMRNAINIWGVNPRSIDLEMTEQAVVLDMEAGSDVLKKLRELGFGVSIDDFGTGYSSLSYFRDIPATELKIDRSFILRLQNSDQDRELVRIIIDIAHLFKMTVVAEGVEDVATLQSLRQLGCDEVQGYYVAKPMPADELLQWLKSRPRRLVLPDGPGGEDAKAR